MCVHLFSTILRVEIQIYNIDADICQEMICYLFIYYLFVTKPKFISLCDSISACCNYTGPTTEESAIREREGHTLRDHKYQYLVHSPENHTKNVLSVMKFNLKLDYYTILNRVRNK